MRPTIIVHGGAGAIAPARWPGAVAGCAAAASAGWAILAGGGDSLDAAIAAVIALEDNPHFNAGTGAVLNADGEAELDAGIMRGDTLDVGAVAAVRRIRNPILLARQVLTSPSVLLTGEGAERFAAAHDLTFVPPEYFIAANQQHATDGSNTLSDPDARHGTVGAVVCDASGHIVAASSTGGYAGKPTGRIGDTPLVGAGFYAEDGIGGAACTGMGEGFIRLLIARRAVEAMAQGMSPQQAADAMIALLSERVQGEGGLIVVDGSGNIGAARNTIAMPWAACDAARPDPLTGI